MKMSKQKKFIWMVLSVCLLALTVATSAQTDRRAISVIMEHSDRSFLDFHLLDRLYDRLLIDNGLNVVIPDDDSTLPPPPNQRFNLDRIIEWGQEVGSRYVIYLQVEDRKIVRRKRTSIPYILNRYIVEGQIDGAYCLVDLNRSKVVGHWKLRTRLPGPRQWQVAEDYPDDPDLDISAPKKIQFYKDLEEQAVSEIIGQVELQLRGR